MTNAVRVSAAVLALVGSAAALAQAGYDSAWMQAGVLEADGRYAEAASTLEPLADAYPQDYALSLQLGWLHFQAEQYGEAETYYRRADVLSEGSPASRLGLAWTLLRQGRHDEAAESFRALVADYPENASAREGLALAESPASGQWQPWVSATGHSYGDHPDVTRGWSLAAGVTGTALDHLFVAGTYRFGRYILETTQATTTQTGPGPGPGGSDTTRITDARIVSDQHEIYLSAGPVYPAFHVIGRYARLTGDEILLQAVNVAGLGVRWSPWGDLELESSASFDSDSNIYRLAPSWSLPAGQQVLIRPGAAVQFLDQERLGSGLLTVTVRAQPVTFWLGGKAGREERTADLTLPTVYNFAGQIHWGAWAGLRLDLDHWSVFAGYEVAGLEVKHETSQRRLLAHWFGLGVSLGL